MAKYYAMGNFSQKGIKGLWSSDTDRASVGKKTCEAMGCKFHTYDIIEKVNMILY